MKLNKLVRRGLLLAACVAVYFMPEQGQHIVCLLVCGVHVLRGMW